MVEKVEHTVTRIGLLFPGQGAQFVGMGADVFSKRPDLVGPPADSILGWSLEELCRNGPEEKLTATEHAQPALYALSFALWEELRVAAGSAVEVVGAVGHSLGEYTALVAAGAISHLDGLRLVAARGRAMADAAALEPSSMAALIGADEDSAEAMCAHRRSQGGRLWVANLNAPGQVVVAGGVVDIEWAGVHVKDHGIRRSIPLKVAGAFHTPFMAPAATALAEHVAGIEFSAPAFTVYANLTGRPYPEEVDATLVGQLTGRVRFQAAVEAMAATVDAFVHVGPGDVTAGMAKRIAPGIPTIVVNEMAAVAEVVASFVELETV